MKNIVQFPAVNRIEEEAAIWLVRIDGGELSNAQRCQLKAWIDSDPRHAQTLRQMAEVWDQLDALAVLAELFPLQTQTQTQIQPPRQRYRHALFGWLWQRPLGTAVTLAVSGCLLLVAVLAFEDMPGPIVPAGSDALELVYRTELGKQSTTELKDGSVMTLNTDTTARVRFGDHERAIFLERGEAYFSVAKNPDTPFVVYAGGGKVRAIGTAFSVRLDEEQVNVAVTEGTVHVVADGKPGGQENAGRSDGKALTAITLTEGGVANYRTAIDAYTYIEPEQLSQKLAWKSGKWIFKGETLADVVAEANRYTADKIEISDPSIAGLRVGGYFNVGDVEPLLTALEAGFGIKVSRTDNGLIQLSATN